MNKLVSKNSIQRFKQGRKIIKGADGLKATKYGEQAYFLDNNGKVYIGNVNHLGASNSKRLTHRYTLAGKQYGSFDGGKTYYSLSEGGRPLSHKANNQLLAAIERGKSKSTVGARGITTPRFLSKYANMADTIGGVNNIRAWQQKLKNYYAPGTYNPDSIWGDNTQAAYERYLADNNINLGLVKLEPVSISPVKESVQQNDFAQDKQTGYPSTETIQSSSPILNQQNDFVQDKQNHYPSTTTNIVSYNPNFNWRNALAESQKLHFVKQGGQLYSRNPIKRFKSNFR